LAVVTENGEALALRRSLSFGLSSGIGISLVREIIGYAGKGVDCVDMVAKVFWDKATHGKVFVVGLSQLSTGLVRVP
jgi:hypothetical protein